MEASTGPTPKVFNANHCDPLTRCGQVSQNKTQAMQRLSIRLVDLAGGRPKRFPTSMTTVLLYISTNAFQGVS
ncbi:hypothetical protein WUBG_19184 [Wuchereria bancrofti]|uniref:Uncharacterized protein n=1 Tax=Wuchereria bancrofti TaxID=6293 RepID=J9E3D1_WUCBA|nr:hypothetical protein WUBG_19184 [Wuchereria bancrofti]